MSDETPVLEKYLERSFLLATYQVWNRAEKMTPKSWTNQSQPRAPYMVCEWNGERAILFYDPEGIKWVKEELRKQVAGDSSFLDWLMAESDRSYDVLRPLLDSEKPLPISEVPEFVTHAIHAWNILEAVWFLIEDLEDRGETISDVLIALLKARKYAEFLVPRIDQVFESSFKAAYPQISDLVPYLLIDEAVSGKLPSQEILVQRSKGYCFFNDILFASETAKELGKRFDFKIKEEPVAMGNTVLKGKCAQAGHAKGRVCIVRSRQDLLKFQKGDILVSPTTTPDFMSAILICAAIIADEGGIVSHAAITSREPKKPCIIGTKIATQVLHDGDLVEVDADNGIVRILNENNG